MKCTQARTILSQLYDREPVTPVPSTDLEYLSTNGYVLKTTKEDYEKGASDVARIANRIVSIAWMTIVGGVARSHGLYVEPQFRKMGI